MPWARLDDRFHENRKVRRAWRRNPAAIGLHVMAITYCAGHLTDGFVDRDFVEDRMPTARVRERAVSVLVDAELWHETDDGWLIHDFSTFNPTRADAEAKHQARVEAGKKGANARWGDSNSHSNANGNSDRELMAKIAPGPARPEPPAEQAQQVARGKRASTRRVDQTQIPDDLPTHLTERVLPVLRLLTDTWDIRGGVRPQERGVALGMMRNPGADHVAVARKLQHWLTAGNGQNAKCKDIAARFADWVADEVPGTSPRSASARSVRESPSDLLRAINGEAA